jgi:hypothetical protein
MALGGHSIALPGHGIAGGCNRIASPGHSIASPGHDMASDRDWIKQSYSNDRVGQGYDFPTHMSRPANSASEPERCPHAADHRCIIAVVILRIGEQNHTGCQGQIIVDVESIKHLAQKSRVSALPF